MNRRDVRKAVAGVQPTLADKLIGYFSPELAVKRHRARVALALSVSYTGASRGRKATTTWQTSAGDADSDTLMDLPVLRERSRDLVRNNPQAGGAINIKVANVVGTGLRLNSRVDAAYLGMTEEQASAWQTDTEREFRMWAESADCDAARALNFYGQQELAFRSVLENGDAFALLPNIDRPGSVYSLAVQLIEADRVCNPNYQRDTQSLSGGVEKDEAGAPVRYHLLTRHPGSIDGRTGEWIAIDAFGAQTGARNMLHLYRKLRIGQTRGVPDLAPVIEALKQIGDYTEAELTAAIVSGMFTAFVHTEGDYGLDEISTFQSQYGTPADGELRMGSGSIVSLGVNEKVDIANPGRPNTAFDPFVVAILRQIGVALEMPFELLIMQFNSSYSASKAALEQAWIFFRARRRWLADNFCQPVYEAWLSEAVANGRVRAPGFLRDTAIRAAYLGAHWHGPSKPVLDLTKEVEGRALMEDRGWVTAAENTAEMAGGDWETKFLQRAKEQRMRAELAGPTEPATDTTQQQGGMP